MTGSIECPLCGTRLHSDERQTLEMVCERHQRLSHREFEDVQAFYDAALAVYRQRHDEARMVSA